MILYVIYSIILILYLYFLIFMHYKLIFIWEFNESSFEEQYIIDSEDIDNDLQEFEIVYSKKDFEDLPEEEKKEIISTYIKNEEWDYWYYSNPQWFFDYFLIWWRFADCLILKNGTITDRALISDIDIEETIKNGWFDDYMILMKDWSFVFDWETSENITNEEKIKKIKEVLERYEEEDEIVIIDCHI